MTETIEGYDVIGDVHGHADKLVALLERMGYEARAGVWTHPDRQAIFVGDLIDRGPKQVETVAIARSMVDAGTAQIVLGNHEFNAIAWATRDPEEPTAYLRRHNKKNYRQHQSYLRQVGEWSDLHHEHLRWFRELPLWLDLGELRVVHACWDPKAMADIAGIVGPANSLTDELVLEASREGSAAHHAIEHLLKGPEIAIPEPFVDKDGHERNEARLRWWLADAATSLRRAAVIPEHSKTLDGRDYPPLPETPIDPPPPVEPYADDVPVFYGHYWEGGTPAITSDRTACVDYSVAKGGPLVAYQWQRGSVLIDERFVATAA
ncbi:MAG: metallophosphoesterase [Acidimicrobiales bacterium]